MRLRLYILLIALCSCLLANAQFHTGSRLEFGKNRIQYKPIDWSFYRYERFDVFFYAGGKELSEFTAKITRQLLPELEKRFDYTLENRLQILIFNRLSDLKQTNLGIGSDAQNNLGGVTRQVGNKVLLHYENGTVDFLNQLRSGIAETLLNEFLYGSDFRDRLRSSALMNIPDWYRKGLVSWLTSPWNSTVDNKVRDGIVLGRYLKFNRLAGEDAVAAGHSIWYYIAETYGEKVIPDIIEMTRVNRNVESGFRYVLGIGTKEVTQEWLNYFDKKYFHNDTSFTANEGKLRSGKFRNGYVFRQARLSPDGRLLAWVRNDYGKSTVWIVPVEGEKKKRIFKTGRKLPDITDLSFPQLAWHPSGELLLYADEYKGRLRLNFYNVKDGTTERKFIEYLHKIIDMDVSPDGKRIVLSAFMNGKTDIYIFNNVSNTLKAITNDWWDDAHPRWMPDGESLLFSSNRTDDTLTSTGNLLNPPAAHDLFLYDPSSGDKILRRLTATPLIHEQQPAPYANGQIVYLSDENGIVNRYAARFDSAIAFVDTSIHYRYFIVPRALTNYKRSITEHSVHPSGNFAEVIWQGARTGIWTGTIGEGFAENRPLPYSPRAQQLKPLTPLPAPAKKEEKKEIPQVRRIVVFGDDKPGVQPGSGAPGQAGTQDSFRLARQRVYLTSYYSDQLVTQIDRSFLNQAYQPYSGPGGYINPSLNGMFRIGISDLFEDYKITGGIRLSGNFSGNEYLLAFQNLKKRIDKTLVFHRQGIQSSPPDGRRVTLHTVKGALAWPFSEVMRIGGSVSYRNERFVYVSTDLANLLRPTEYAHWGQTQAELVFDNTFPLGINMMTGTRFKITAEYFHRLNAEETSVAVLSADFRHYIRLARELIFAGRLAGATSFGPRKLLFYLGGVDNWFMPRFDQSIDVDETQNYIFQTIGTNMRGFYQNIRNGNSFVVLNAEVRWNMLKFLHKYPLRSDFFNSMQVVAFGDIGTAYTGRSPYSHDNTFNQQTYRSGPITVIVENQREPVVGGYGMGLRSRLLGYFVRADLAWGISDGRRLPRIFYLSLCTDF